MLEIKESEIRKVVKSSTNYRIGLRYLHMDMVQYLEITKDFFYYHIEAIVVQNEYINRCKIVLNEEMEVDSTNCSCPFHNSDSACAHIAMLMMFINELQLNEFPYVYGSKDLPSEDELYEKKIREREERRARLLKEQAEREKEYRRQEQLMRMQNTMEWMQQEKEHLMHQYLLTTSGQVQLVISTASSSMGYDGIHYFIELRIGITRMYKVKDVFSLLEAITEKKKVRYGKELEFIHHMDAFDEPSKQILEFLYQNCQVDSFNYRRKQIIIDRRYFEAFYSLCDSLPRTHCTISANELSQPIQLHIHSHDSYMQLECVNYRKFQMICTGEGGFYTIQGDTLIKYSFFHMDSALRLIQMLHQEQGELLVPKERMQEFYKYVLYPMKEDLELSGDISDCVIEDVDVLHLYGDMDDRGLISIHLEGYIDGERIYGFDAERTSKPLSLEIVESYLANFIAVVDEDVHTAYLYEDNDTAYTFVKEGLPFLHSYCEIFVSDALKKLGSTHHISLRAGVSLTNGLLELDVSSMDIDKDELMDVLKAYRRKRKYHRLRNGKLISLEAEELKKLDEIVTDLHIQEHELKQGVVQVPSYRVFHMDDIIQQNHAFQMERSAEFEAVIQAFQKVEPSSFDIPVHYESILRDYQKYGFQWLKLMNHYHFGAILADDMGLGKTLQVIALLESEQGKGTSIVITPSSLVLNWKDEIEKFASTLSTLCILGNAQKRKQLIQSASNYDVLITSYDYLRRDVDLYENMQFYYIVLDEAQYIKNQKTRNAQVVKALHGEHRLALSGTPIENTLAELWSIFDFLMPNYLFPYHYFQHRYERAIVKDKNEDVQKELKEMVTPFILRRNKKEVLTELPDKVEHTLTVPFYEEEQKLYLATLAKISKDLQAKLAMDDFDRMQVLAMLTRLRQICCEPRILYENIDTASSKLTACMELILSLKESGQRVLLFSSFTSVLELLEEEFYKYHISYLSLTGKTKKEERRELVKAFQEGNTDVFLISLKAGGTGLNLTAAQAVIHFDPWWNVSAQNQATDRAYRIGQEKNVQVFKLIMKDSIEEKIQKLQMEKKNLADAFIEGNSGMISSMNVDEIMDLFK